MAPAHLAKPQMAKVGWTARRTPCAAALACALAAAAPAGAQKADADAAALVDLLKREPRCALDPFALTEKAAAAGLSGPRLNAARAKLIVDKTIRFDAKERVITLANPEDCPE